MLPFEMQFEVGDSGLEGEVVPAEPAHARAVSLLQPNIFTFPQANTLGPNNWHRIDVIDRLRSYKSLTTR